MKLSRRIGLIVIIFFLGLTAAFAADLIIGSNETYSIDDEDLFVSGSITIYGTLEVGSGLIQFAGDWNNYGDFIAGSGTVHLLGSSGTVQNINGSTVFNNFSCTSEGLNITFEASATQTIGGTFTLNGGSGSEIILRSSITDTQWLINPVGGRNVSYVDVRDSNNLASIINPSNSIDSGNNTNWFEISLTVTTTADSGTGSLRQVILDANAVPGRQTIIFNIPTAEATTESGVTFWRITPQSQLPAITKEVHLDATTQAIFAGDTNPDGPEIELDGSASGFTYGISINASNCTIEGLAINNFNITDGAGIYIDGLGSDNNRIIGNYIGTDVRGLADSGNYFGVYIYDQAKNNLIGGTSASERNIISGNDYSGIQIINSTSNEVKGNYIGTNATGTATIENTRGIYLSGNAQYNHIGGTTAGERNMISGNNYGVYIAGTGSSNNEIKGNYIGTNADAGAALPNNDGIYFTNTQYNYIGGSTAGERNIISGNNQYGISISGATSTSNEVIGNYIGTNIDGTLPLTNETGVILSYCNYNNIGGSGAGETNIISGNTDYGVRIFGTSSNNNVKGNYIGTDATGTATLENGTGIFIQGGTNNNIGGSAAGEGNVISGNKSEGIYSNGSHGNNIKGNYIGTDKYGTAAIANNHGVSFLSSRGNFVGGGGAGEGNLISGNVYHGVYISSASSYTNEVRGNYIGTDVNGTADLGNGYYGIYLYRAPRNIIGGSLAGERNIISGNNMHGIVITYSTAVSNEVKGNYIGTDVNGTAAIGNTSFGVYLLSGATYNIIGGSSEADRNIISGNNTGMSVSSNSNEVKSNYIGLDVNGASLPNSNDGILMNANASFNFIGPANYIANNGGDGVHLQNGSYNLITRNTTEANAGKGIRLEAGANSDIPKPLFTNVTYGGGLVTIEGSSTPEAIIELFKTEAVPGPDKQGEGKEFLTSVEASVSGYWTATVSSLSVGDRFTATATDKLNDTSEFAINGKVVSIALRTPNGGETWRATSVHNITWESTGNSDYIEIYYTTSEGWITVATNETDDGSYPWTVPNVPTTEAKVKISAMGLTSDESDAVFSITVANMFIVTTTRDAGEGSLRQCITDTNTYGGVGTIIFNIPTAEATTESGVTFWRITPQSQLPAITKEVHLDATTQAIFAGDTNPDGPEIELDGSASGFTYGISINASNCTIEGLAINNFNITDGAGIYIDGLGSDNNRIIGNYIGTDVRGLADSGNYFGVYIYDQAKNNLIGGASASERNIISGNDYSGIQIINSTSNEVKGNYIGTNATGTATIENSRGIYLSGNAQYNRIGGTTAGERNMISGNNYGVYIAGTGSSNNEIKGNYIGTNADAGAALPNNDGIYFTNTQYNYIGGSAAGERNIISGNNQYGISISGATSTSNEVIGNYIGTNIDGTLPLTNETGVILSYCNYNNIGGSGAGEANIISGNSSYGVYIFGTSSNNNVKGNYIGTDATGTATLENSTGIFIQGGTNNNIGGSAAGEGNVISGNKSEGIYFNGSHGNNIKGNYIGTDKYGTAAIANYHGVHVFSSKGNFVGGGGTADGNLVSGNNGHGVYISGSSASTNEVKGNLIGTDVNGTADLGNGSYGVYLYSSPRNIIGGSLAGERNIISGNNGHGIVINYSTAVSNEVKGNYIGTDVNGTTAIGNAQDGVYILSDANNNVIGGTAAGEGNILSGNGNAGIYIYGTNTISNEVKGNYIGTDVNGTTAIGNTYGVYIRTAYYNYVTGGNLISGNSSGIYLYSNTSSNEIKGNYIGTDKNGTAAVANGYGIHAASAAKYNIIGGGALAERNIISGNTSDGIRIEGSNSFRNKIIGNYIGTASDGTTALANNTGIVLSDTFENEIGGDTSAERNVVSGNDNYGIYIINSNSTTNEVKGNYVGSNASGAALGNGAEGIYFRYGSSYNQVGPGNIVANNGAAGIRVGADSGVCNYNLITQNSLEANAGKGISIEAGANNDIEYPTITWARYYPSGATVIGTAPANALIEIFKAEDTLDQYNQGEGKVYLTTVTAEADGTWITTIESGLDTGEVVTATASLFSSPGYTSEFAKNTTVESDFIAPSTPEALSAEALPSATPTYVHLTWSAATDEGSGVAGYNMYRSTTPESGYTVLFALISGTTTDDASVSLGTDYYYRVTAVDNLDNESDMSNIASAPLMLLTREAIVTAPAGYSGSPDDPVPGAVVTYYMYYNNKGFALADNITIIDKIPSYTEYKIESATGESVTAVQFSSNNGSSWDYTPTGTYVDPLVTHIRWICSPESSGSDGKVEYQTIIR